MLMGLDTVVVAFFVVGVVLVLAGTLTMGTNTLVETSYNGYVSASQTAMERLHTNIEIKNPRFDEVTNHVHFTVENTGENKLSDFNLWDFILVKDSQASYLVRNEDFTITFTSDIINPGILDPHETIDIEFMDGFDSGDDLLLKITTENGIASSAHYIVG
jgi:flagellar protein FlaF